MRYINSYIRFDFNDFMKGKELEFVSVSPWYEKNENGEKVELGSKVTIFISKDKTAYPNLKKDGNRPLTNSKEMMTIKVRKPVSYFDEWEEDDRIGLFDIEKATPWSKRNSSFFDSISVISSICNLDKGYGVPEKEKDDQQQTDEDDA